jgi:hypothetical protein
MVSWQVTWLNAANVYSVAVVIRVIAIVTAAVFDVCALYTFRARTKLIAANPESISVTVLVAVTAVATIENVSAIVISFQKIRRAT